MAIRSSSHERASRHDATITTPTSANNSPNARYLTTPSQTRTGDSARSCLLFDRRFNLEIDVEAIVRELLFAVGPHGDDELVALNVEI
jgi:hypothetical protein